MTEIVTIDEKNVPSSILSDPASLIQPWKIGPSATDSNAPKQSVYPKRTSGEFFAADWRIDTSDAPHGSLRVSFKPLPRLNRALLRLPEIQPNGTKAYFEYWIKHNVCNVSKVANRGYVAVWYRYTASNNKIEQVAYNRTVLHYEVLGRTRQTKHVKRIKLHP